MFVELLWIDALVRSWLKASKGGPVKPTIPPDRVKRALEVLHRHAPSIIMSYRRDFPNFDDLYRFGGMERCLPDMSAPVRFIEPAEQARQRS